MNFCNPFVIVLAESREVDKFAALLEDNPSTTRSIKVLRCPLVTIKDTSDEHSVQKWLDKLIAGRFDYIILYSGEGVQSLLRFAKRANKYKQTIDALKKTQKLTRGSKPIKELRKLDLKPDIKAIPPTTDGAIKSLRSLDLTGKHAGVQLYDNEQNKPLMDCLQSSGATSHVVKPYIYGSQTQDSKVVLLLEKMIAGNVDMIAFTSSLQVRRLGKIALKWQEHLGAAGNKKNSALANILENAQVASIGPMVDKTLDDYGITADIRLNSGYGLKPLAKKIIEKINTG